MSQMLCICDDIHGSSGIGSEYQCNWPRCLSHLGVHEQHAVEVVQRLRLYSENYVEPVPPAQNVRDAATRRDTGMQGGLLDGGSREH